MSPADRTSSQSSNAPRAGVLLAGGSIAIAGVGMIEFVSGVLVSESSTSLWLTLLLLVIAVAMAVTGVRMLPAGVRRHDLAVVALTLVLSTVGLAVLFFGLLLIALSQTN